MAEPNLQEIHDVLFDIALEAGDMITAANPSNIDTKKNSSDLVTETDKAVEEFVFAHLRSKYPDYSLLGEETSTSGTLTPSPTFVLDPIDGTTNFVHSHPYISISLAFSHHLRPLVGIVYNPFTQHIYHAIHTRGAFLTCPSIPTSHPPRPPPTPPSSMLLSDSRVKKDVVVQARYETHPLPLHRPTRPLGKLDTCLVAVEWGNERSGKNFETKTKTFNALAGDATVMTTHHHDDAAGDPSGGSGAGGGGGGGGGKMVHSLRSLGSAALNMCAVARADIDAYWEGGCWAWDVAAGWVIVEEAGGKVVGANAGEWEPRVDGRRYLVVRAGEQGKGQEDGLIRQVWEAVAGRLEY